MVTPRWTFAGLTPTLFERFPTFPSRWTGSPLTPVPFRPMRFFTVFALVALAEMATFFWVESRIGLGWALGLALLTALVGSVLVRRAGLSVLGRIRSRAEQGQMPGRELSDGAAVLVSGAFLISPGFITDVLGFLLLVPAVRALVYRYVSKKFSSRITFVRPGGETQDDVIDVDGWE